MNNQDIKIELNKGGYFFPLKIMNESEAISLRTYYHKVKKSYAKKNLILEHYFKTHLLFQEINELIRNKEILDVAEKFIGPNILFGIQ